MGMNNTKFAGFMMGRDIAFSGTSMVWSSVSKKDLQFLPFFTIQWHFDGSPKFGNRNILYVPKMDGVT
jgi:hypothetical protein